ncbi:MAG TPA: hypothetical protein DEA82_01275 [Flavobacteriaceae bacterium]|nr:hypothetical protein [Flavobacteriaceae bacterium]HBR52870.1 hypothetical protein [Flavobacteriaceae bacterium]
MLRTFPKSIYVKAAIVFSISVIVSLVIYVQANKQLEQELEGQTVTLGTMVVNDFERTVRNNVLALENLKDRIEESNGEFMNYFESDAMRIMSQHPAIKFVEWIDENGIIREIHPIEKNKAAYLLDIKPIAYRYNDWLVNSKKDQSNMTSWVALTQQGKAFLIDVPIFIDGDFKGTVSAGMDFESQFNDLNKNLKNLDIKLVDEEGNEFYRFNKLGQDDVSESKRYTSSVQPIPNIDKAWSFQLLLGGNSIYKERDLIQKTGLSYGFFISLLVGLLVIYFLQSRERTKHQMVVNNTLVQLNQELKNQKRAAQEASKHKSDFISNMSHEIRTPLNAILGFVEILHAKNLLRNERLYLRLMKNSAQNLLGLVNDILDIHKIEAGKAVVSKEVFKPSEKFRQLIATYESQIVENNLSLKTNISTEDQYAVISDSSKFNQIITNIISNAIKFTSKGGIQITYDESLEDGKLIVTYTISDTGVGIPKDKLQSIFQRFVQVENGTKKRHVGGGLGLAITHELVQLLGGTITVTSKEKKGSSFTVCLPMDIVETPTETNKTEIPDLSGLRCLIIDDNRINRMILFNFLQKTGVHIDNVGSGRQAIAKATNVDYDIVFMDVHMPDMDGFETTRKLLEINQESTVIGVSADVTLEAIEKAKASGMKDYLTKPIEKEVLFETLGKLAVNSSSG